MLNVRVLTLSSCSIICFGKRGSSSRAVTGKPEGDIIGGTRNGRSASTLYQRAGISLGVNEIRFPVIVTIRGCTLSQCHKAIFRILFTPVHVVNHAVGSAPKSTACPVSKKNANRDMPVVKHFPTFSNNASQIWSIEIELKKKFWATVQSDMPHLVASFIPDQQPIHIFPKI